MYQPRDTSCWHQAAGSAARGIYWLPNLFTHVALFAGFYAIVQAMNSRFETRRMAIFVAMVFDGLDGRVARLTHTQSAFGAEYDSLSDMVSFGAAPALVIYEWALKDSRMRRSPAGPGYPSSAGSPPSSIAPAPRCGWRASTPTSTSSTSATSRACRARPRRALIAGLVWAMNEYQIRRRRT